MGKATIIVQARMGSTRLPGKIMMDIAGRPMLAHIVERLKRIELARRIIVATTDKEKDDIVANCAKEWGVLIFRGSEKDVLDRYYMAARQYDADEIVRITADCPLVDPKVVDKCIDYYRNSDYEYVSNILNRTYPDGLDVEVFSSSILKKAWKEARLPSEREHVTPYIWKNPSLFRLGNVENEEDISHMRWVVDSEVDLEFVRQIYRKLYKEDRIFLMEDILRLLRKFPELEKINRGIPCNEGYDKSLKEDRIPE